MTKAETQHEHTRLTFVRSMFNVCCIDSAFCLSAENEMESGHGILFTSAMHKTAIHGRATGIQLKLHVCGKKRKGMFNTVMSCY